MTTSLLKKTTKNRVATLDRFLTLQNQIKKREELILTLQKEIDYTISNIDRTTNVIDALQQDISNLEKEYGQMARNAYRQKLNHNNLLFIFSAGSINQAFRRWQYLKQYDRNRKRTANLIHSTQKTLDEKLIKIEESKLEKETLLEATLVQQNLIEEELEDKNKLLYSLQKDESRLRKELVQQQANHEKLNTAIEGVIRKQIAANRKRERSKQALADANTRPRTKPDKITNTSRKSIPSPKAPVVAPRKIESNLSSIFSSNKGRLPWPVQNGIVTKHFGKQPHPTLKKIEITNNGIDILTDRKAKVRAVFKGEVVGVQFIPGYNNMLILKHGDYYTVYSNLDNVQVQKGEIVATKQMLGRASVHPKTQKSEVHFEVWKDKKRMNPIRWVNRK